MEKVMTKSKKPLKVVLDTRLYEDVEDDPKLAEELHKMVENFKLAAERSAGKGEEAFNDELEKLTGYRPQKVDPDTLSDEEKRIILERTSNPKRAH
jgi:hypothetical protein